VKIVGRGEERSKRRCSNAAAGRAADKRHDAIAAVDDRDVGGGMDDARGEVPGRTQKRHDAIAGGMLAPRWRRPDAARILIVVIGVRAAWRAGRL